MAVTLALHTDDDPAGLAAELARAADGNRTAVRRPGPRPDLQPERARAHGRARCRGLRLAAAMMDGDVAEGHGAGAAQVRSPGRAHCTKREKAKALVPPHDQPNQRGLANWHPWFRYLTPAGTMTG